MKFKKTQYSKKCAITDLDFILKTEESKNSLKTWAYAEHNSAYNRQAKSLVYYPDLVPPFEDGGWSECHNLDATRDLEYWTEKKGGYDKINISDELARNMIATIEEKFAFIGITDLIFDSVGMLSEILGVELWGEHLTFCEFLH